MKSKTQELRPNNSLSVSKNIVMTFAAFMVFGYAAAQVEPVTSQKKTTDTIIVPTEKSDDNTANKGILHRNTLEAGTGKPDNMKRKLNKKTKPTDPQPLPKVKVDTTTKKREVKLQRK